MPHYSNYGGTYLSAQPADELTGTFNALNETTNFKPTQREEIGIIHPSYMPTQGDEIGIIHPSYKPDPRGYDTGPIGSLSETFGDGDPRILGPISGEGVFKPQSIDAKGSVIVGDNHFKPGRGGDSLTGEGRPTKIWTTGGTSEDKLDVGPVNKTADTDWGAVDWNDLDVVIDVRENLGANSGPGGTSYMTESFEPAAGMDSFGRSLNPVLEVGGNAGPGGSSFMTGQFEMPTNNIGANSGPGGTSF